ncbi:hypothetical protein [Endozoicomonas sp. YOMI1]|uniref:hypothetical protein n=1 Tax=Endozoicomonas sp. YOMI1 TaxID=2828739 RepID=UPI0021490BD0|nr:hypothetical protein [Endozoicomonas sp. YOMI1]
MGIYNLSSFNLDFSHLYFDLPDLKEQTCQSEQQPTYHGIPVQTLDSPSAVYHSQSDMNQHKADSFNSLNKYNIDFLKLTAPADTPDTSQSVPDENVPGNSGNETVHGTLSSTSGIPFIQQECLSGSEPEIREPTPVSHSNTDDQLTDLPVVPFNPQHLPPVTVPNLNQTTSDNQTNQTEEITDGHPLIVESQRECTEKLSKDPLSIEHQRENTEGMSERSSAKIPLTKSAIGSTRGCTIGSATRMIPNTQSVEGSFKRSVGVIANGSLAKSPFAERVRERYQSDPFYAEVQ